LNNLLKITYYFRDDEQESGIVSKQGLTILIVEKIAVVAGLVFQNVRYIACPLAQTTKDADMLIVQFKSGSVLPLALKTPCDVIVIQLAISVCSYLPKVEGLLSNVAEEIAFPFHCWCSRCSACRLTIELSCVAG
jgi:hypothetical protein